MEREVGGRRRWRGRWGGGDGEGGGEVFSRPLCFNCSDSSTMRLWTGAGTGTRGDEDGEGGTLRETRDRRAVAQTF